MNTSIADLSTRDQILITGEDSARFLQGQLTCDVSLLNANTFSYGAVCNTKGRVVANFLICQIDDDGSSFLLETEQGMGELLGKHLSKYAVFYKAEITSVCDGFHRWGIISSTPDQLLEPLGLHSPDKWGSQLKSGDFLLQRLPDIPDGQHRLELIILSSDNQHHLDFLAGLSIDQWRAEEIKAGYPLLAADVTEKFTPQELNLDLTGAVSFTKGCYTGQEIVARMHYRGKARKRLYHFCTGSNPNPDDLETDDWQLIEKASSEARTDVFNIVRSNNEICGLVILKDSDAENDFFIRHPSGRDVPVNIHAFG